MNTSTLLPDGTFGNLYEGRIVVITGAGNGIGQAAMQAFIDAGARVVAHLGREVRAGDPVADAKPGQPGLVAVHHGDFTQREAQDRFVAAVQSNHAAIDVLVNNAGTMFGRFAADSLSDEDYDRVVELNQGAVVRISRGLIPLLRESAAGAIISTVSISASTGGSPGSSIYSSAKAFVSTWSRAMARELAPHGVRVNAISPGVIDTDFHQRYSSAEKLEKTRQQIPLGRLGSAADCAPAFLFLGSAALSGYITGQVLEINGGQR